MRRFFKTFLAMGSCATAATLIIAYPQARILDAPERGWLATAVTLTAFFAAQIALVSLLATICASGSMWLTARLFRIKPGSAWLFCIGSISAALALALTMTGQPLEEIAGFTTAWIFSGGVGTLSVAGCTDVEQRGCYRTLLIGTAITSAISLGVLALQST